MSYRTDKSLIKTIRSRAERDALDAVAGYEVTNIYVTTGLRRIWQTAFNNQILEKKNAATSICERIRLEGLCAALPHPRGAKERSSKDSSQP